MYSLDLSILYFFNRTIACGALDTFFDAITNVHYWFPIYVIAGIYLIYRFRWRGAWMVLGAVIVVSATDSLGHYIVKPLVHRDRPCGISPSFSRRGQGVVTGEHVVNWIRLPDGGRGDESFPSNHALNNFAIATFFFTIWPRKQNAWWLFVVALLISLGRMYQGLHYPSDVLGGAVIGSVVGYLCALVLRRILAPSGLLNSKARLNVGERKEKL
ncbi:MAG TPA: phosphatase PAP2 family protein [Candidatus Kapabacteria bacterium]|nr:phosphatase PAP2 family protein [Candidatus Kapabacteria bacterium]